MARKLGNQRINRFADLDCYSLLPGKVLFEYDNRCYQDWGRDYQIATGYGSTRNKDLTLPLFLVGAGTFWKLNEW